MEDEKFNKLQRLMDKGKWHYICIYGVLGWGVSTAILFSLLQVFSGEAAFFDVLPLSLILFPIGGLFWEKHTQTTSRYEFQLELKAI